MLSRIKPERKILDDPTYLEPKRIEPIEKESIMAVARSWEKWADAGQGMRFYSPRLNKFSGI